MRQFDFDGTQHKFDELWQRKGDIDYLEVIGVFPKPEPCMGCKLVLPSNPIPLIINFPEGADPIIFERARRDWDTSGNQIDYRWSYFGYKRLVEEKIQKVFLVVHHLDGVVSIEYDDATTRG